MNYFSRIVKKVELHKGKCIARTAYVGEGTAGTECEGKKRRTKREMH